MDQSRPLGYHFHTQEVNGVICSDQAIKRERGVKRNNTLLLLEIDTDRYNPVVINVRIGC